MRRLHAIKQRLGPLWWYTLIMFCVQRVSDVINLFVGLWLVPHYVPQSELGAVLPLVSIGSFLGLPLMIVMGPFLKYLNMYATHNEYGKVKALLRDGFILVSLIFLGIALYAQMLMPPIFERMRVAEGNLGLLIVLSGAVAAATPIATTALQGLHKFRTITLLGILGAPIRLAAMALFLPIRGLSGYFVGQTLPNLMTMGMTLLSLRQILKVKAEPYWRADSKRMLSYLVPYGIGTVLSVSQMAVETFIIRHRLPDMESAGYYIISRFAETGYYVGMTMIFVAFPLISARHEKGISTHRLMWHSMAGTLAAGAALAVLFLFLGPLILGSLDTSRPYVGFVSHMAILTLLNAIRLASFCFINHEMACHRFSYLGYCSLLTIFEVVTLYGLTGYQFFAPYVPEDWLRAVAAFNPCRLSVVLSIMFTNSMLIFGAVLIHALRTCGPPWRQRENGD